MDEYVYIIYIFIVLKLIINILVEFVVKTELCLNLKCLLMLHFIEKYNNSLINNEKCLLENIR